MGLVEREGRGSHGAGREGWQRVQWTWYTMVLGLGGPPPSLCTHNFYCVPVLSYTTPAVSHPKGWDTMMLGQREATSVLMHVPVPLCPSPIVHQSRCVSFP